MRAGNVLPSRAESWSSTLQGDRGEHPPPYQLSGAQSSALALGMHRDLALQWEVVVPFPFYGEETQLSPEVSNLSPVTQI